MSKKKDRLDKKFDIVVLGNQVAELLSWVDVFPDAGDGIRTSKSLWTAGGMGGNLAHAVAQLGGSVALISALGDDNLSDLQLHQLTDAGVNIDYVFRRENTSSPVTVLMINSDLERAGLVIDLPPEKEVHSVEIPDEILCSCKVFFTDMVPVNASINAVKRCKELNIPVAYDMQMAAEHVNVINHNRNISIIYKMSDIFFSDVENFCLWRRTTDLDAAILEVQKEKPNLLLVITKGRSGSVIVSKGCRIQIPAFSVPVVDTIGAGDAFHGAFLFAYLIMQMNLKAAGLFASATAALSCRAAGARNALPDIQQVMSFLREHKVNLENI